LFSAFIPRGKEEENTRGKTSFKATNHDSKHDERFVVGDESHADGDNAPEEHDGR
jgi:hypothetical protein